MSKGSNPRPLSIPKDKFNENFERIFSKSVKKPNRKWNEMENAKQ